MNFLNIKIVFLIVFITTTLIACGVDVGGNEDKTSPQIGLTSLNSGEEVIGTFNLTWATDDPNPSTVDIYLSTDSGATYPTVIGLNVPDTGSYDWDTNSVDDCRNCRLRIIPQDVVGNVGEATESAEDFIVNNVPQVLGVAYYYDLDNNSPDAGDEIRVSFDKDLEIRTAIASDIFFFPVLGDSIGPFATVAKGVSNNELIITMDDNISAYFNLHIRGVFKTTQLDRTAPSGINLQENITEGIVFSPDTGRTAATAELGIDILPTFTDSGQILNSGSSNSIALGDVDGDGDLDMVVGKFASSVWLNGGDNSGSNTGVYTDSGQTLGSSNTSSIALGDVDGDGDLDMVTGNADANRVWLNGGDNSGSNTGVFVDSGQALNSNKITNTTSIVLGDVDGDGDLDIVVGSRNRVTGSNYSKANGVWLNGGDNSGSNTGIFSDTGQSLGSSNTSLIILGDVDGDGDLDIVAGNENGGSSRVWLNGSDNSGSNTGVFIDSNQTLASANSIALGDVDGDGDLDIVAGSGSNRVWLNGGDNNGSNTGVFTDSGQTLGNSSASIALGDIDGDGDLDVITGNYANANRVWFNGGDSSGSDTGVFTDSGQALGSSNTWSIALGDVDGDGDYDLVVGNTSGDTNRVWLNSLKHPSLTFMLDSGQQLGNRNTSSTSLGDVDGDGDLDMVVGNYQDTNRIWLNGGDNSGSDTGVFTDSGQILDNANTNSIALGDIDGDGDLDMVVGIEGNPNRVWFNGGDSSGSNTGIFTDSGQALGGSCTQSIALGDVDGDGDLDMVTGNGCAGGIYVWLNGGNNSGSNTGVFTDSAQVIGGATQSIALGDVDGDGDIDILAGSSGANSVWLNGGDNSGSNTGVFTDSGQALGNSDTNSVVLGDIDGDGDLDIVAGNTGTTSNRVWLNGGDKSGSNTGVFSSSQALGNSDTRSVALGDVDGDGDLDIVAGNYQSANRVWVNGGDSNGSNTGVFTGYGQALDNGNTRSIALGDIDGDGDLDMVAGNDNGGVNRVWLNDF